jgi:hypothetical protein
MPRRRESAARFPISQDALVRRINRKLAPAARVRRNRGGPSRARWPEAWVQIDLTRHVIVGGVDLDKLGRELGVLAHWEQVVAGRGLPSEGDEASTGASTRRRRR